MRTRLKSVPSLRQKSNIARRQRGAIMLVTVSLLLIMITLVTLYTGRIQSFEHRIVLNGQNQSLAFSAAQAGLMQGFAQLQAAKTWPSDIANGELLGQQRYQVSTLMQSITTPVQHIDLYTLISSGQSADGMANVTVSEQAMLFQLLVNVPDAPLTVAGGLAANMTFMLVANTHGLGEGIPLSIRSNGDVDMDLVDGVSCDLIAYENDECVSAALSSNGSQGSDIIENSSEFPVDLLRHLFAIPTSEGLSLKSLTNFRLNGCSALPTNASALVWVEHDCVIEADTVVGDPLNPLLMIIHDGKLVMEENTKLFGLVILIDDSATIDTLDINMHADSLIMGAVVVNFRLGQLGGRVNVVYQSALLNAMLTESNFRQVARVPGSWKDF
jgi:hypothetical protein